jgi:hypothetical protein
MGNLNGFCKDGKQADPPQYDEPWFASAGSLNEFWNAGSSHNIQEHSANTLSKDMAKFLAQNSGTCTKYIDSQCAQGGYAGYCGCDIFGTYYAFKECYEGHHPTQYKTSKDAGPSQYTVPTHRGPGLFCGIEGDHGISADSEADPVGNTKFHPRWRQQAFFIAVAENMCTYIPEGQQRIHDFAYMGYSFESDDFICEGSGKFQPFKYPPSLAQIPDDSTMPYNYGVTSCYWRAWTYMGYPENDRSGLNDFDENGPTPESIKAAISPGAFCRYNRICLSTC